MGRLAFEIVRPYDIAAPAQIWPSGTYRDSEL